MHFFQWSKQAKTMVVEIKNKKEKNNISFFNPILSSNSLYTFKNDRTDGRYIKINKIEIYSYDNENIYGKCNLLILK